MKNLAILFFLVTFALSTFGQTPKPSPKKSPKPAKTVAVKLGTETEEFDKAKAIIEATERITALKNFIQNFPESTEIPRAQALIVSAHAELADKKLEAGDMKSGFELFKIAVQEAPTPISDELFTKVILGFPISLYSRNQRSESFEIIKLIEEKAGTNANQILDLSKFFINIQYGTEAIRLAKKSTELAPDSATGYLTLAIANRLNFQLEDAANAYAKASELDSESVTNKRSLAEMKRALGKTDEAISIYREILAKDSSDTVAQTGLTLALFDSDKIKEAEAEMAKSLEANPNNTALLVGAAYWYAAHNESTKAVEYSQKAIEIDRSFVWAYIAQARGLLGQNKPLEAEKILLVARQHGDFPTLDYELASVRLAAGLYREAAETLKRNFTVNKEGSIETYLGNRILADANTFTELLSLERRVALFEVKAADSEDNTNKLKSLLNFNQKLEAKDATEDELAQAADDFAKGGDTMRLHRQLFAASRLLQKKAAPSKVLELMQAAIGGVDSALNVASPSSAVLADELYDTRQYSFSQNLVVNVTEIPRQTLSAILRGRIEDTAAQAYFQQNDTAQSFIHLKRALSILPDKSAWLRTSYWHMGEVLQADGKDKEALESFIKGYNKELPDSGKRAFIENLYVKVNWNVDGLDDRIGPKGETSPAVATTENKTAPNNTDNVKSTEPTPSPEIKPEPSRIPKTEETPQPTSEVKTEEAPQPTPEAKTETPQPTPEVKTDASPVPKTEEIPENKSETKTTVLPENVPAVIPEKTPENLPSEPTTEKTPEVSPSPAPDETPKTEEVKTETKTEEVKTEPTPNPTPTETPITETQPTPVPETTSSSEIKTEEKKPEEPKSEEPKTEENKLPENKQPETKPEPTPESSPVTQYVSETKTGMRLQFPPSPKTNVPKTEVKSYVVKIEENTNVPKPSNTPKPLFEPVVINVGKTETPQTDTPKTDTSKTENAELEPTEKKPPETIQKAEKELTETPKTGNTEPKPNEEKPPEPVQKTETEPTENPKTTDKPIENSKEDKPLESPKTEDKPIEKPADEKLLTGENRPRIIITETTGANTVTEEISTCKLIVNPNSLSLLNGGGSLGVMVGFDGKGNYKQITAASSSADDVEVTRDPDIGASQNRAFFIIKSISKKTGAFTVTFEAPCGKKEILVKIR